MSKWSERVLQKWESTNVAEEIAQIEIKHKKYFSLFIALIAGGSTMACASDAQCLKCLGVFLLVVGVVNLPAVGLWTHIRLSALQVIHEMQKQKKVS